MPKQPKQLYVPRDSFWCNVRGHDEMYSLTMVVDEDDPARVKYPHLFKPAEAAFRVEQATAAPGEVRS